MTQLNAKDAKNKFGQMLDLIQREPVTIAKNGRPVAVVLSLEEYQRLESLEESYWSAKADQAIQEGFLGEKESEDLLKDLLDA